MLSGRASYDTQDQDGFGWRVWLQPTIVQARYVYGSVALESLEAPPRAVTKRVLGSLDLRGLMRQDEDGRRETLAHLAEASGAASVREAAGREIDEARPGRLGGYRDEHWREVLSVYEAATKNPTKTVCEHFRGLGMDVPYGTAARWVSTAKRKRKEGKV